nr:hypothetical protein [uncultured Sphingomonas sp.]
MIIGSIVLAVGGVPVADMTQLPIVSNYAECILRKVGPAVADASARRSALEAAKQACRALKEADYAEGRLRMNGKSFPKSWWDQVGKLLDAEDADVSQNVLRAPTGGSFKVKWELPDRRLVDAGEVYVTGTVRVRIAAA